MPLKFKASDGALFAFKNKDEALTWAVAELSTWEWLKKRANVEPGFGLNQLIRGPLEDISNAGSSIEEARLVEKLGTYLAISPAIHAKSRAKTMLEGVGDNVDAKLFALVGLLSRTIVFRKFSFNDFDATQSIRGYVEGAAARPQQLANELGEAELERARQGSEAILALRRQSAEERELILLTLDELKETVTREKGLLDETQRAMRENASAAMTTLNDDVQRQMSELQAEWKRLAATYDDQLALRAPATYWRDKKKSHSDWVLGLSIATVAVGAVGGWALYCLWKTVLGGLTYPNSPSWSQGLTIAVSAIVYLWSIRSLLRFLMSHIHLALDAAERQTMIVSYLALVRRQDVPKELIERLFQALFRPTGDGIVREETIPLPGLMEAFRK